MTTSKREFLLTVSIVILALGFGGSAVAQHPLQKRDALQDSIAWVPQELQIPGVVAGNALWFDFNNDGKLDILMAGESENGPVSGIYRNQDTGFVRVQSNIIPVISENGLAWGDFNNDGDLDFAIEGRLDTIGTQPVTKVYEYKDGKFTDIGANFANLNGGSVTWVDYDNDGHLDLLVSGSPDAGSSFSTTLYRNIKRQFYEEQVGFPGVWGSSIAWADYDNDGFIDVVISGYGWGGTQTVLYHNAMSRGVIGFDPVYNPVTNGSGFTPVNSGAVAWLDCDNDGYQDLVVTGAGYGGPVAKIYHNDHDGTFTDLEANLTPVSVSAVAVGDYDNDGFVDLAISGGDDFMTGANPKTKIYHNNGNLTFTDIGASLTGTWFGSLDWGDYDNDGRLDLLVTGATLPRDHPTNGSDLKPVMILYKNMVIVDSNAVPTVPSGLAVQTDSNGAKFSWSASTDRETSQKAITYNLRVGTTPGGFDVISPLSNTSSGFRRMPESGKQGARTVAELLDLPPGTYYWSVQAVDNQYAGSPFSSEKSFVVTSTSARQPPAVAAAFSLKQNYPNPFNPSTTIEFVLPHAGVVSLKVFDALGNEVSTLADGWSQAGPHQVKWNARGFASGVYWCRLQAGSFTGSKAMILVR